MLQRLWISMRTASKDEQGAAAIEYGLLAALIALGLFAGAQLLGTSINTLFTNVSTFLGGLVVP